METPKAPPRILQVEQLKSSNLLFLVKPERKQTQEEKISLDAGRLVGRPYRSVLVKYLNPDDEASQKSLNVFCVRLVFLLYAEDSVLFEKGQFHDYLKTRELFARDAFRKLFVILYSTGYASASGVCVDEQHNAGRAGNVHLQDASRKVRNRDRLCASDV